MSATNPTKPPTLEEFYKTIPYNTSPRQTVQNVMNYSRLIWGFPKIRGTFLGGPYNKDPLF